MSVLIKGAKPPSGCAWCYFNDDSKCALIVGCDYDETNGAKRRTDCPLIELPNHGDLIDRDALVDDVFWDEYEFEFITEAPVVIPAERNGESLCDNCDERSDVGCSWCKRMERSE